MREGEQQVGGYKQQVAGCETGRGVQERDLWDLRGEGEEEQDLLGESGRGDLFLLLLGGDMGHAKVNLSSSGVFGGRYCVLV